MSTRQFTLTQAELAVLCRHLLGEDVQLGETAQEDLGVSPELLDAAEAALRERGWLLPGADGELEVAEEPAAVVATTIVPERLVIVRTSLLDREEPTRHFSWVGDRIVHNVVNARGEHEFAVLDNVGAVVDEIIAESRLPRELGAGSAGETAALEKLVAQMQALTMFMAVEQPREPEPVVRALSWLLAGGGLWLVDAEQAGAEQARRVDQAALRRAVGAAIGVPGSNGHAPVP